MNCSICNRGSGKLRGIEVNLTIRSFLNPDSLKKVKISQSARPYILPSYRILRRQQIASAFKEYRSLPEKEG